MSRGEMTIITSRSNPKIKEIRALRQRKERQEARLFLVEGIRHVGEAIQAGARLDCLCFAPELLESAFARQLVQQQAAAGVNCLEISAEVFESIADKENPQGILAVVHQPQTQLADLTPENFPWGVALMTPQDPGNIGTILRTIDAVGASGLILLEGGAEPYHPSAVRASMGTLFWRPVVSTSFAGFKTWADQHAYTIYGTSAHASQDYREVRSYQKPAILLMGSEREGLTTEQSQACRYLLRLPMYGRATSLNLAVATGVMLYAMLE